MTDLNTMTGDGLSTAKPMMDGSGVHLAEQVGIKAERLSGTVKDGLEAARDASRNYGNLFMDTYARMIQASMRNGLEMGEHMVALTQARTLADVFKLNVDFMQRRMSTAQERLLDMMGVKDAAMGSQGAELCTSYPLPKIVLDGSGQRSGGATNQDERDLRIIQA